MNFKEVQDKLQNLTKSKISLTQIGEALNIKRPTVSIRAKNNSELKYEEIKKIERFFNVKLTNENNFMQSVITYEDEKIQKMINDLKIGITAYGIYWALVEKAQSIGLKVGNENQLANEFKINKEIIKKILNDYDLFFIKNQNYYSVMPEHHVNDANFIAGQFEAVKTDILKEVENLLKRKGIT